MLCPSLQVTLLFQSLHGVHNVLLCPVTTHQSPFRQTAKDVVSKVVQELGRVDVLVNNASEQHVAESLTDITPEELQRTFETNIFGYFYFAQVLSLG